MKLAVWRTLCGVLIAGLIAGAGFADGITSGVRLGQDGIFNTGTAAAPTCATSLTACDAATQTVVAAMSPAPDGTRRGLMNTLILSLKSAGIWAKLDVLYVFAAENAQNATINWITPGTFTLTRGGTTSSFFPNRGYQGYGTTLLSSTFVPSTSATQFTLNDGALWAWMTRSNNGTYDIGNFSAPLTALEIAAASTSNGVNQAAATSFGALTGTGLWGVQRTGSAVLKTFKNGVQAGSTLTTASTALSNSAQVVNTTAGTSNEIAFMAEGASLTGLENSFYTAVNTFMTAVLPLTEWNGNPFLTFASQDVVQAGASPNLQYEYTQPWTAVCVCQIFQNNPAYNVIFTNVNTTPFPGYEMVVRGSTGGVTGQLFVRIIHDFSVGVQYIEVADTSGHNWADGLTHIFAATYDGSGLAAGVNLWVDGVQLGTTALKDTLGGLSIISGTQNFDLGFQINNPFPLSGYMYHFALSTTVRSNGYLSGFTSPATLPAVDASNSLYYLFPEGTGTTTADTSSNHYTGALQSANMWRP